MKKRRVIALATAVCLLLTGCGGLSLNSPDLLAPPRAQGNQAEIQELIQKNASGDYLMIYPQQGEYQSSVIFSDFDGDGDEEAVAMYTTDKENIKVLLADKSGSDYTLLYECSVLAPRMEQVEFADFDGDGRSEVLLTYPGISAASQSLTVISPAQEIRRQDMFDVCAAHQIGDYDGNGVTDLLTLDLPDGNTLPSARLFFGSDGELKELFSCEIDAEVKEYLHLSFGKLNNDINGAVIDSRCADGAYSTQLICYDYNVRNIVNPLYIGDSYQSTKRSARIFSADVDRDGVFEIPVCSLTEYSQGEDIDSVCGRIDWSSYDYTQLSLNVKQSAILCDRLGFLLNLSPEHADIVTARYIGDHSAAIYLWEYKRNTPARTAKLVTVNRYDKSSYDSGTILEAVAGQNSDCVYTYVIETTEGFYGFTDDEVTNNFVLIEDPADG